MLERELLDAPVHDDATCGARPAPRDPHLASPPLGDDPRLDDPRLLAGIHRPYVGVVVVRGLGCFAIL
jgi:hypothetical protein